MAGWVDPTSKVELEEALDEVIRKAYENGVTVSDTGYDLSHDGSIPGWEVKIIRVANER